MRNEVLMPNVHDLLPMFQLSITSVFFTYRACIITITLELLKLPYVKKYFIIQNNIAHKQKLSS